VTKDFVVNGLASVVEGTTMKEIEVRPHINELADSGTGVEE